MDILARLLTKMFMMRFAVLLLGLAMFLLSLDLVGNGQEVIDSRGGSLFALAQYGVLRLPEIFVGILKFASLFAGLLTMTWMARHNELAPIWGVGISPFGMMLRMAPVTIFVGLLQLGIEEKWAPSARESLRVWDVGENLEIGIRTAWLHLGPNIVRIPMDGVSSGKLENVIIFERDQDGGLLGRIDASEAVFADGKWYLADVVEREVEGGIVAQDEQREWDIAIDPGAILLMTTHPRSLTLGQIFRFSNGASLGHWQAHYYRTWLHARLAAVFTPFLMLCLVIALSHRFQRVGHVEFLFLTTVGLGFSFFFFNSIGLAMGEAGVLPSLIAGWAPMAGFGAMVGSIAMWHEGGVKLITGLKNGA